MAFIGFAASVTMGLVLASSTNDTLQLSRANSAGYGVANPSLVTVAPGAPWTLDYARATQISAAPWSLLDYPLDATRRGASFRDISPPEIPSFTRADSFEVHELYRHASAVIPVETVPPARANVPTPGTIALLALGIAAVIVGLGRRAPFPNTLH